MSLPRLAIRLATLGALRGRTEAGDLVYDSAAPPPDVFALGEKRPYIMIFTDDGAYQPTGADLMSSDGSVNLVIEIGISALQRLNIEGVSQDVIEQPPTDALMELALDMIERQIKIALHDPANPWSETWRSLVKTVTSVKSIRGASAERGLRFAGRQLELTLTHFAEPPFGPAPKAIWSQFLVRLESDSDLGHLAPQVRKLIEADAPPAPWTLLQQQLNATQADMEAMELGEGDFDEVAISEIEVEIAPAP